MAAHRVLVLDMQPITPAVGGGRLRLLGLYHNLGNDLQTTYVGTYDWPGEPHRDVQLTPSLREVLVPLSPAHFSAHDELQRRVGKGVIDTAFHTLVHLSPEFLERVFQELPAADIVVCSHPWVYPAVADGIDRWRQLLVYDAHNVEGLLRLQLLDDGGLGTGIANDVVRVEAQLCRDADVILCCSPEDASIFHSLYSVGIAKLRIAPNGVFTSKIVPASTDKKSAIRRRLGVVHPNAAIFIGSAYDPNVEAAEFLIHRVAPFVPSTLFVIAGGVGSVLGHVATPSNVVVTGHLTDEEKLAWLQSCDLAVNPMFSGSGTNIKMFDFLAAGLPVVSTEVGARGIPTNDEACIRLAGRDDFAAVVRQIVGLPCTRKWMSGLSRGLAEQSFSWERISQCTGTLLRRCWELRDTPAPALTVVFCGLSAGRWGGIGIESVPAAAVEVLCVRSGPDSNESTTGCSPRVSDVTVPFQEMSSLMNAALALARGEHIAFAAASAADNPDYISRLLQAVQKGRPVDEVFSTAALRLAGGCHQQQTQEIQRRRDIDLSVYLGLGVDAFTSRFAALFERAVATDRSATSAADWLANAITSQPADSPRWTVCPAIPEVFTRHSGPVAVLEDLLEQREEEFITAVFSKLLGRAPDPAGLCHYQWALREGRLSREEVIADICRSSEYASRNVAIVRLADLRDEVENAGRLLLQTRGDRQWMK